MTSSAEWARTAPSMWTPRDIILLKVGGGKYDFAAAAMTL